MQHFLFSFCEIYAFTVYCSWKIIMDMPTARFGSAAVQIPNFGILVIGGRNAGGILSTAIVLNVEKETWTEIAPMNKPRFLPCAVYFQESVLVVGYLNDMNHSIEQLKISPKSPWQWTIINSELTIQSSISCLFIFKDELLLSCKSAHLFKLIDLFIDRSQID